MNAPANGQQQPQQQSASSGWVSALSCESRRFAFLNPFVANFSTE